MIKKGCIFCDYEDKGAILYRDSSCYAVISKNPINKHHVLVIPREHYENFIELPDELASHIFLVAKRISKAVKRACNPDAITHVFDDDISRSGYNLIAHYKFHIIPRFKRDIHVIDWSSLRTDEDDEARSKYALEIKKYLR
jgi:histidine triad (HIT) family protein